MKSNSAERHEIRRHRTLNHNFSVPQNNEAKWYTIPEDRRQMKGKVFVGTSGWYYKHWRGPFYPPDIPNHKLFEYYSEHFSTVEINSTFYHTPKESSLKKWKRTSPPEFIFSVKASRYITHLKKLRDCEENTLYFLELITVFGEKLGPVLFQLPPGLEKDTSLLEQFLAILPSNKRYTFEFRNTSWFNPAVYNILKRHNVSFCIYEYGGITTPLEITSDFVYIRLHGPTTKPYRGKYDRDTLKTWAQKVDKWAESGKDVFFYFDNDEKGYAAINAMELKDILCI